MKLLIDLCECNLLLFNSTSNKMLKACVPCLLKVALKKEESEKAQKEVEIALLALSNAVPYYVMERELYLSDVTEIIKYHQEHHNLTRLAYQSVWEFLTNQLSFNQCLKKVVEDDLHFVEEVTRELEELRILIDWKREEKKKGEKEKKEVFTLKRWLRTLESCFLLYKFLEMKNVGLDRCIIELCRASREYERVITESCLSILQKSAERGAVGADALLKAGVANLISDELQRSTLIEK
ncbi:uncharacterized protein MONOS_4928 [Monocercomonoides exilis]|uniref:uncharacterized protein n=1 Tax=Monocercomonoides exilis TaxID=2049356 RepID=UPI003559FF06|nr:hypothetical protein MONOS_4928 [Monocercomonoides exilis]|eukprot:MONOS_4928.1-p1 / transcript=MONOS_4928.1 / gene=MONOS_4928 / organism=Monocercomonoides_exilis_PA203 / gene_product=unspecified product / transcript_product=unspecified product / location=Mono_scaffold00138:30658-31503(+) / protein_length=238 / sequence_SO=supercontig / SO=protein_coding / is_pseudo=false